MDRLIIESILEDVNEIQLLTTSQNPELNPSVILVFRDNNVDQVIAAFEALKQVTAGREIELIICSTLVSGVYDLEIKTDALDEPVRIVNKAIDQELLAAITSQFQQHRHIGLGTNVSPEAHWLKVTTAQVKECTVKFS